MPTPNAAPPGACPGGRAPKPNGSTACDIVVDLTANLPSAPSLAGRVVSVLLLAAFVPFLVVYSKQFSDAVAGGALSVSRISTRQSAVPRPLPKIGFSTTRRSGGSHLNDSEYFEILAFQKAIYHGGNHPSYRRLSVPLPLEDCTVGNLHHFEGVTGGAITAKCLPREYEVVDPNNGNVLQGPSVLGHFGDEVYYYVDVGLYKCSSDPKAPSPRPRGHCKDPTEVTEFLTGDQTSNVNFNIYFEQQDGFGLSTSTYIIPPQIIVDPNLWAGVEFYVGYVDARRRSWNAFSADRQEQWFEFANDLRKFGPASWDSYGKFYLRDTGDVVDQTEQTYTWTNLLVDVSATFTALIGIAAVARLLCAGMRPSATSGTAAAMTHPHPAGGPPAGGGHAPDVEAGLGGCHEL